MPQNPSVLFAAAAAMILLYSAPASRATVVWSDDFTGQADATFPSRDFNGDTVPDWIATSSPGMFTVSAGTGEPAPSMNFADATTGGQGVLRLEMTTFAPFTTANPDTPQLRISFDWKVASFLSSATNEGFRMILRANNSQGAGSQIVIAFNRADLDDGDGLGGDLTFYAGSPVNTSNFTASATSAIGLIPGVGWQPGFDFGQYGASEENDSDDLSYRFQLSYDYTTGVLNGAVTRLALDETNGLSAEFTRQLNGGLEFSNTGQLADNTLDLFLIASTNGVTGLSNFDNFQFEAVPEPSSASAVLLGLGAIAGTRVRRGGRAAPTPSS